MLIGTTEGVIDAIGKLDEAILGREDSRKEKKPVHNQRSTNQQFRNGLSFLILSYKAEHYLSANHIDLACIQGSPRRDSTLRLVNTSLERNHHESPPRHRYIEGQI
jgi:hypothetical protein